MTLPRRSGVVLIVDDDADIREVMREILTLRGHSVVAVANGREALEWLRGGGRACVILLDLMMPEMNGWEFRERQLQDPRLAGIPVVVLTGIGRVPSGFESLRADQILLKPVDLAELTEAVARFC